MAIISDSVQTLSAAFSFGILLQAAASAFILFFKGHGSTIFHDYRRLVLISFTIASALWAQIGFLNFMIPAKELNICQGTIAVSTFFDQAARTLSAAFLLWTVAHTVKSPAEKYGLACLIGARAVGGGIFTLFTRPQFAPLCLPRSAVLPVAILIIGLDTIIIGIVMIRIFTLGFLGSNNNIQSTTNKEQGKALTLFTVGFAIWTGTSVTLHLGITSIILLLRTAIPATGLVILITILTIWPEALLSPREAEVGTPESQSPFIAPPRPRFQSTITGDGSPVAVAGMTNNGRLFVVNPSTTPNDSPQLGNADDYDKSFTKFGNVRVSIRPSDAAGQDASRERRASSGVFGNVTTIPTRNTALISAPAPIVPLTQRSMQIWNGQEPDTKQKRSFFSRSKRPAQAAVRKLAISQPILVDAEESSTTPFVRMQTVDLATAAANEQMRREEAVSRRQLVATRPAPPPPTMPPSEALKMSVSTVRKKPSGKYPHLKYTASNSSVSSNGSSSSSSLSPGHEEVRRRSPRQTKTFDLDEKRQYYKPVLENSLPQNPTLNEFEATSEKPQTVMFMKDIVYDDPSLVRSIINDVPNFSKKTRPSMDLSKSKGLSSSNSVLHRARPYKKAAETEQVFFPSESSPNHRRTKSGSSVLRAPNIGSPTLLPPLPAPPAPQTGFRGLLKDHISNMSNDEKISMLFPMPPGGTLKSQRRSSVPSLPSNASVTEAIEILSSEDIASRRASRRSTIISLFPDQKQQDLSSILRTRHIIERDTYRNTLNAGVPDLASDVVPIRKSNIPPHILKSAFTETTIESDDSMNEARESIPPLPRPESSRHDSNISGITEAVLQDRSFMALMLNINQGEVSPRSTKIKAGKSAFLHDSSQTFGSNVVKTVSGDSWHTRIGDEIPTFSNRPKHLRSKSTPPPAALTLWTTKSRIAIARPPVPTVVVDTPNRALKEIQAQLRKLEQPSDILPFLRDRSSSLSNLSNDRRNDLLAELENEAGEQENMWLQLHRNINRDSRGSEILTPLTEKRSSIGSVPSAKAPSIRDAKKARVKSIVQAAQYSAIPAAKQDGEKAKPGFWKDKLEGAQKAYADNAPSFLNLLSNPKAPTVKPEPAVIIKPNSKMPPISAIIRCPIEPKQLWQPQVSKPTATVGFLWTAPQQGILTRTVSPEPAALDVRPAQRRINEPLRLESLHMWSKPTASRTRPTAGLWRSKSTRPTSIVTRPKTQKPVRKSKIISYLPDIVESPSPLPHRRDTLGIFKFPWGEKSDQAVYQPVIPMIPSMPDLTIPETLASNGLSEDYSSSLFDDYDDHEYQSDFSDFDVESPSDDEGSDDGFDESTLWEIANLLDSTEVPSRNSLLPELRIIEDYDNSDDEVMPAERAPIVKFMPIMPLSQNPKSPAIKEDAESDPESFALTPEPVIETKWPVPPVSTVSSVKIDADGLPGNGASSYLLASPSSSLKNASEPTAGAETPAAWLAEKSHLPKNPRDTMIIRSKSLSKSTILSKAKPLLWAPSKPRTIVESTGLFTLASSSRATRVTNQDPAAADMVRKPRPSTAPLPTITSSTLWSDNRRMSLFTVDWISESTVRARSPSIASSSGRSSPETAAESDALSMKTVSTKASSLWSESSSMEVPFMLIEAGPVEAKKVSPISKRPATPEEWDEALAQAIQASAVPAAKVQKPTATKAMWEEALQEALQASAVSPTVSPVGKLWSPSSASAPKTISSALLWQKDELRSSTDLPPLSPLAGPIVKKSSVSLSLPELTSTSLWSVSSLTDGPVERNWMHEAASISQHASAVNSPAKMWSPLSASAPKTTSSVLLWSKDASLSSTDLPSLSPVGQVVKKSPISVSSTLPKLTSTSLWSVPSLTDGPVERNWMHETVGISQHTSTVNSAAKMWSSSSASAPKAMSSALLWSKDASLSSTDLPSFSPVASQVVKKSPASASSALPELTSTTVWSVPSPVHATERNWMSEAAGISQHTSTVNSAGKMWSPSPASVPTTASSALLWSKDASLSSTDLPSLSPVVSQAVKKSPTSASSTLQKLTSTSLWSVPSSAHAAERNWMSETALVSQILPTVAWTSPAPSPAVAVPAARSLPTPTPSSPPHSPASASSNAVSKPEVSSPPPALYISQPASPEMELWSREAKVRASLPVVQNTRLWHPSWASWGEEEKEEKSWVGKRESSVASFRY